METQGSHGLRAILKSCQAGIIKAPSPGDRGCSSSVTPDAVHWEEPVCVSLSMATPNMDTNTLALAVVLKLIENLSYSKVRVSGDHCY